MALPYPSVSLHPSAFSIEISDEVEVGIQGWNEHHGWGKAQRKGEG